MSGFTDYSQPPLSYTVPPFPSLYWPFDVDPGQAQYLYSLTDIWRFVVYWTLITVSSAHFLVAAWGVLMQFSTAARRRRYLKSFDEQGYEVPSSPRSAGHSMSRKFSLPGVGASKDHSHGHDGSRTKGKDKDKDKDKKGKSPTGARRTRTKSSQYTEFPAIDAVANLPLDTLHSDGKRSDKRSPSPSLPPSPSPAASSSSAPKTKPYRPRMLTPKNRKLYGESPLSETLTWVWSIPLVYLIVGGIEGLLGGSIVGLVLGAVYNAGYFRMSTWTPLGWGIINVLVLILGSFRIQGGL